MARIQREELDYTQYYQSPDSVPEEPTDSLSVYNPPNKLVKSARGFDLPEEFEKNLNFVLKTIREDIEHIEFNTEDV